MWIQSLKLVQQCVWHPHNTGKNLTRIPQEAKEQLNAVLEYPATCLHLSESLIHAGILKQKDPFKFSGVQKSGQVFSSLAGYLGADYVANFSRAKISAQLAELRFHLGLLNKSSQKDACDYMYMGRLSAQAEIKKNLM